MFETELFYCLNSSTSSSLKDSWRFNPITQGFILVLLINLILWVDFVWTILRQRDEGDGEEGGFLSDLVTYSSNSLCCVLLVPLSVLRKTPN